MRRGGAPERFLATILFTDIVGSTELAARLGDRAWRELLEEFYARVRRELRRYRGRELDTAGDGLFAAFEVPGNAIACAITIRDAVTQLQIEVRSGLHVGEVERVGAKVGGIAVHIGARVAGAANPGEVLVTSTVRDLTGGSGISFEDRGDHQLKGVTQSWRLYAVRTSADQGAPAARSTVPARPFRSRGWWNRHPRLAVATGTGAAGVVALVAFAVVSAPPVLSGVEANSVGVIDPGRNAIAGQVASGSQPSDLAFGEGSLWVTNTTAGTVSRIDVRRLTAVDTIQVGVAPEGIAIGEGAVWVANNGAGTVSRINPSTNTEVAVIPVGNGPTAVAASSDSIWVANAIDGTISRIDPSTGRVAATLAVGAAPSALAADADALWVANRDSGTVTALDTASGRVGASISVGSGPQDVAIGFGSLWVVNRVDATVSRVDLESRRVVATIVVAPQPSGIAVTDDAVWVTSPPDGTIVRIDPASSEQRSIAVGSAPERITSDDAGRVWFSARATIASHRGGTLRIAYPGDRPPSFDPHLGYDGWDVTTLTNDGLVGFRRIGGSGGGAVVPNLAESIPTPGAGGLTYEFTLRDGLRYADGTPVRASDFRRSIERSFDGVPEDSAVGTFLYQRIVGADACVEAIGTRFDCNLSEGIRTDDAAGSITFTLSEPDPEFLYKLALPAAFAVPSDLPFGELTEPIPATGPYMVAEHGDAELRLVRNPEFTSPSVDARPDGFPDEIAWTVVPERDDAVDPIVNGDLDALLFRAPPERLDELATRFTGQLHVFPQGTIFVFFNTTMPPFDDRRVREAVSYAVDRDRVVELAGGPFQASVTCQVIQPNFLGYRRICPHTTDPEAGVWTGPNFARARQLIDEAGVAGTEVELTTIADGPFEAIGEYLVTVLEEIGLRATLTVLDGAEFGAAAYGPDSRMMAGLIVWFPDYPAPSTFVETNFACTSTANLPRFCDPELDERMQQARELQSTDPSGAAAIWAELDATITEQAPWVPLATFNSTGFVSERVGNVQIHPQWGILVDQLWVE